MSAPPRPVRFLYDALDEFTRTLSGMDPAEAENRPAGGSSIAWTAAHTTQMLESWLLGRFIGLPRHPLLSDPSFGAGAEGIPPPGRRSWM